MPASLLGSQGLEVSWKHTAISQEQVVALRDRQAAGQAVSE